MMDPTPESSRRNDRGSEALAQALGVSFSVLRWVIGIAVVIYLFSGFYEVKQHERGLVVRFGALPEGPDRIVGPGFHITLPKPFATVIKVPTERTQSVETRTFWEESLDPQDPLMPEFMQPDYRAEMFGYTLTGDANILHSKWALRFRISDPEIHTFVFRDVPELLRHELDRAVVRTSSRLSIDQALRTDIEAFRVEVEAELEKRVDALRLGVQVLGVDLTAGVPPLSVAPAFAAVVGSENERSQRISTARGYAARTVNEAKGEAARVRTEAEAFAKRFVDEVSADADYFEKILAKVGDTPTVLLPTLLQDTLRRTLKQAEEKFVIRNRDNGEIRIHIGREQKAAPGFE